MQARDNDGNSPLMIACANAQAALVQHLLELGADVEARNEDGSTPLVLACRAHSLEAVQSLLNAGADITAHDRAGNTPMEIANQVGDRRILRLLRHHEPKL